MTIPSFTALLRELILADITYTASEQGKIKISGPRGALTEELRQAMLTYKDSLLALYSIPPYADVPQSFKERPCARCGQYDVRRLPDGIWMCSCYWTWDWRVPQERQTKLSGESAVAV